MLRIRITAFCLSVLFCTPVLSDQHLTINIETTESKEQVEIFLRGDKAKIISKADQQTELVYDNKASKLYIINHLRKTVITVDQTTLSQWSSLTEGIANIAREQGGILGDLLGTFGMQVPEKEQSTIKIVESQEQRRYADVNCKTLQIIKDKRLVTELCQAQNLGQTGAEHKTLLGLLSFGQVLLKNGKVLLQQFNMPLPVLPSQSIKGVPVFFADKPNQVSGQLVSVSQAQFPANHYEIPEDYTASLFGF